ncbi:hypothetical protein HWV62_3881 [Athelia sp. TMB]|nr:hypothetical protein HWV62_3881 [Athelia sp. TMB]
MFINRKPSARRPISVMSTTTDNELLEVAAIMSSTIANTRVCSADEQENNGDGLDDELDAFIEPYAYSARSGAAYAQVLGSFASAPSTPSMQSAYGDSDPEHLDGEASQLTYPAFHLPRPRLGVFTRDSDTPSLSSSNSYSSLSSYGQPISRGSPPVSPAALVTPIDIPSNGPAHLAIIEERISEDQGIALRFEETRGEDTLKQRDVLLLRRGVSPLAQLKLDEPNSHPYAMFASPAPSAALEPHTAQPSQQAPSSPGSAMKLARFISKGSKSSLKESQLPSVSVQSVSSMSTVAPSKSELKQQKAEEKRRKKEEAKARTEQLALDLKAKAKHRSDQQKRTSSINSAEKKAMMWLDGPPIMFGGLGSTL